MGWNWNEVITIVNPKTGEQKNIKGTEKDQAASLVGQGWLPVNTIAANELKGAGIAVPQTAQGTDNVYNTGDLDMSKYIGAKAAADLIMKDNNRAYGADNPYMQNALSGIEDLKSMSKSTEPSVYAKALLDKQDITSQLERDKLIKGSASDIATARSNLAMQGGLDSGARERIFTSGNRALMENRQGLAGQNQLAKQNIYANDAAFKQNLATQIPGMYNPYAQGKEQYEQNRQGQYMSTIGNIYGTNK